MKRLLSRYLGRYRGRSLLLMVMAVLLLLNLGRWLWGAYQEGGEVLDSKRARIEQFRQTLAEGEGLRVRLGQLKEQRRVIEQHFFKGETEEKIASTMQIKLQDLVTASGLEAESIRPIRRSGEREEQAAEMLRDLAVKTRLVGTLEQFLAFIASVYEFPRFFRIESYSLRPYKKAGLKIAVEFRGYYLLVQDGAESGQEAGETVDSK